MENNAAYKRARKKVEAKVGFYIHLGVYLAVCVMLVIINASASPDYVWVIWPVMGWGIGLLFHALMVFVFYGRSPVTEQMIEKELRRSA